MKFPTKDELELLDPPLRDLWKEAINRYWSEKYEEYEREQRRLDPMYDTKLALEDHKYL